MEEKILNDKVDELLVEMEKIFKESAEKQKPLQEELDNKVRALMDEYDSNEDIVRFEKIKAQADYIALTLSMPLAEETKEKIIEELVKGCEENGVCDEEVR